MTTPGLLRDWRKQRGLTQSDLATRLGVSGATLSDWEAGKKTPRIESAVRIERVTEGAVPVGAWLADATTTAPEVA